MFSRFYQKRVCFGFKISKRVFGKGKRAADTLTTMSATAALTLRPLLELRGGGFSIPDAVSTIAASDQRDHAALLVSLVVMLSFEAAVKALVSSGVVSTVAGRKMLHIMCGPLFISLWPLFSGGGPNAKWLAALCPLFMTLKVGGTSLASSSLATSLATRHLRNYQPSKHHHHCQPWERPPASMLLRLSPTPPWPQHPPLSFTM